MGVGAVEEIGERAFQTAEHSMASAMEAEPLAAVSGMHRSKEATDKAFATAQHSTASVTKSKPSRVSVEQGVDEKSSDAPYFSEDPRIEMHLNNGIMEARNFRADANKDRWGSQAKSGVYLVSGKGAMNQDCAHAKLFLSDEKYLHSATHSVFSPLRTLLSWKRNPSAMRAR